MARATGLEPATSGVTGRRSNQLNYARLNVERIEKLCPQCGWCFYVIEIERACNPFMRNFSKTYI